MFPLMTCRYEWLQILIEGYNSTNGVPLIGLKNNRLIPYFCADDIGLYYCIPKLVSNLGISLDQTLYLFFWGILSASFIFGACWLAKLPHTVASYCLTAFGMALLLRIIYPITDLYLMYACTVLAVVPFFLWLIERRHFDTIFLLSTFFVGLVCATAHYFRAFSGLAPLLFVATLIVGSAFQFSQKAGLMVVLLWGMIIPTLFFKNVYKDYAVFVADNISYAPINLKNHVMWHTVYLGFGFLNNNLGIAYNDAVAAAVVKEADPSIVYTSAEYEAFLRDKVMQLMREHPWFVLQTLFAKLGIIFGFLIVFANGGLLAAWFYRKPCFIDLAFAIALSASAVFGLLAVPTRAYLLGFITLSALYGMISIQYACVAGAVQHTYQKFFLFKRLMRLFSDNTRI